jgi:hypothetical protein
LTIYGIAVQSQAALAGDRERESGGYRVIYFVRPAQGVIWMLTIYPKNVAENIPAHVLRQIRKEVGDA